MSSRRAILSAFLLSTAPFLAASDVPPAGSYQIDAAHSKVGFEVSHLVISTTEGKFTKFQGSIDIGPSLTQSKTSVTIDAASIDTANADRDKHLRSKDFFDVEKFPTISSTSTKWEGTPADLRITGKLSMHGVTKDVVLTGRFTGAAVDPWGNQKVAFKAQTKVSRKEFGLSWNNLADAGPVVGDEVTIGIVIEAGRPVKK